MADLTAAGREAVNKIKEGFSNAVSKLKDLGKQVVDKIKEGISEKWEGLTSWFNNLWDKLFKNRSVDVEVNTSENGSGHAIGLDYVPTNNYPAMLHRGEAVLTAREADEWRRGKNSVGNIQINQYIQTVPQTPVELSASTAAYFEQARWAMA